MQQSVHARARRRLCEGRFPLAIALVLALSSPVFAGVPTLGALNLTAVDPFTVQASANVTSNGGSPPISGRGFVFSLTADDPDPLFGGVLVNTIFVPGTLGTMTRNLAVVPGYAYSVKAWASNPIGTAYTAVGNYTAPCPAITLGPLPDSYVGATYGSYASVAGGSGSGYSFAVSGLPPGLSLDPFSGYLSGSPTATGSFPFTITVTDASWNCGGFRNYTLTIDALGLSPKKLDFASELVGVPSSPRTVTVTNGTPTPAALGGLVPSVPQFVTSPGTCAASLPALSSCSFSVVYTPSAAAVHNGTLPVGPMVVSLRGAGTASAVPQVYVSNLDGASVSVIDPVTNAVRTTVGVGVNPGDLVVVPGRPKVYVPNQSSASVNVISTVNYAVTAVSDPLSTFNGPFSAASTPAGDEVWVLNAWNSSISIIDTSTDTVVAAISDPSCIAYSYGRLVANPTNHEMYAFGGSPGRVCVFNRVTRSFVRSILVGDFPGWGVVLPDGSALYVNAGTSGMARVALPSDTVTYITGVYGERLDMKADGSRIYVPRLGAGFGFINTATNTFTPIPLSGAVSPSGVAVHDSAGRVYVTDYGSSPGSVHVVDLATNTELPNPELPIKGPGFAGTQAIAAIKAPVAPGTPPTVTSLSGTPSFASANVSATVASDGGLPIFERGFAYSDTDPTPEPGEPGVSTVVVAGTLGPMGAVLPLLASATTYSYQGYAKNVAGTGLSGVGTFTTLSCPGLFVAPSFVPNGIVGSPYNVVFSVSGSSGPFSFSYLGLPPGLSATGGTVSGSPTAAGVYTFDVTGIDTPTGCFATASYSLVVGTPPTPGSVVISEFRTHGFNGPTDEYVEIGNRTSSDVVVASTDGSGGWSIGRPGTVLAVIPDGTVIGKGGHWLATGSAFSLGSYGAPDSISGGDLVMGAVDIPDDAGIGLFMTADDANYSMATRLDAVGSVAETDPLLYEGTRLPEVVGPSTAGNQTAWVRRLTNAAIMADVDDNNRDFIFVAGDGGSVYGPGQTLAAVLGAPNPEDSQSVHDVLQAEFPAALLDPTRGENRYPNREVSAFNWVQYRRIFTNNTGKDIASLAFKVINLTTLNARRTLAVQADLRVADAPSLSIEAPVGSNNFINVEGSFLDDAFPSMYAFTYFEPNCECARPLGGINSRVVVPLGLRAAARSKGRGFGSFAPSQTLAVNFKTLIWNSGYYLYVVVPQISFQGRAQPALRGK